MTNSRARSKFMSVTKSADEDRTSTATLANDSKLFIPVKANTAYGFQLIMSLKAHATPDFKCDFAVPSGTTGTMSAGDYLADVLQATSSIGTDLFVSTNDAIQHLMLQGTILTSSTSGNLQFRWSQNTSDANSCILKAGTTLIIWES